MSSPAEIRDWEIRQEGAEDGPFIAALNEAGFGPGRYAKTAYRLREGVRAVPELGFVAIENGTLRGSVRFWPVKVGHDDVLLLGPLAVDGAQRRPVGRRARGPATWPTTAGLRCRPGRAPARRRAAVHHRDSA